MKIQFKCNECESELNVGIENDNAQTIVCLECGEQHHVIAQVQSTVSSHNTYRKESWLMNTPERGAVWLLLLNSAQYHR